MQFIEENINHLKVPDAEAESYEEILEGIENIFYQIKITASPATSLFALTNTLHPVVNRCLFGCPKHEQPISADNADAHFHK